MFRLHALGAAAGGARLARRLPGTRKRRGGQGAKGGHVDRMQRHDCSRMQHDRSTGWGGAIVRHRVLAAARGTREGWLGTRRRTTSRPVEARRHSTAQHSCKPPHRSAPSTRAPRADKPRGLRGGTGPRGTTQSRHRPAGTAPPPTNGRRHRDASDAVLIVSHATSRGRAEARHGGAPQQAAPPVSRRAPPRRGPRTAPPGTKPAGSAAARFRLRGTRVRDPP